ncbi:MAG: hypothetical protein HWN81_02830 [Candidatus Lokiarchaeota archaeon]|nr:hypothetical protein [Candidatus Lokiarchaeota archaeon]
MTYESQDLKIKSLIQVCKESGDYNSLASAILILTSNQLNMIGILLGLKARNRDSGESFAEYMEKINQVFMKNLGVFIFQDETIEEMNDCEPFFDRDHDDIPYNSIRTMFKIYYKLRKLDIPNLYRKFDDYDMVNIPQYKLQSYLSSNSNGRHNKGSDTLKPLILQKLKEKQLSLQRQSQKGFNSHNLELAILLKRQENSLNSKKKQKKIKFEGKLKDNISYQQSIENVVGYLIIGVFVLLFVLGTSMLLKSMFYPQFSSSLSYWSLLLIGGGAILFLVYFKYFIRRRY